MAALRESTFQGIVLVHEVPNRILSGSIGYTMDLARPSSGDVKVIGVGGIYSEFGRRGYGVEIDMQTIVEAIVLMNLTNDGKLSHKLWKDRWRSHLMRSSTEETIESVDDSLAANRGRCNSLASSRNMRTSDLETGVSKRFLLLPPTSAIDSVQWLENLGDNKLKVDWKMAQEMAFAPPILRRFNPMLQSHVIGTRAEENKLVPRMVNIVYQVSELTVQAYLLSCKLTSTRITVSN